MYIYNVPLQDISKFGQIDHEAKPNARSRQFWVILQADG